MRLCINCGWSCGLITATSGSRASKSVRCSVASRITAFTTLKIFVATSDVALLPFEKAILNFSTVEQNETESETFLWHGNWIRHAFDVQKKIKSKQWLTYDGWWTFCRLYSNIRGRHVVNHKSAAFHYFSSGQRLDIGCLVHIECPVCKDHIFWRNLDWLIKKDGTKYEMVLTLDDEKLVEFASV